MLTGEEIRRRIKISPGTTLMDLAKCAFIACPENPASAFDKLRFQLPWLNSDYKDYEYYFGGVNTPPNVHPFAFSGGDLVHFGFLTDEDLPTDERPIVVVDPSDYAHIVAPNLRGFLGLLLISTNGELINRYTNAIWFSLRKDSGDVEHEREIERLSKILLTIPGVENPRDPEKISNSIPDIKFKL
jgi:hypothetical protein